MESEKLVCQQPGCDWRALSTNCQDAAGELVRHHLDIHLRRPARPDDYSIYVALQVLGQVKPDQAGARNVGNVIQWLKGLKGVA